MARIVGTNQDDSINGTFLADVILGLAGNDVIRGGAGDDRLFGDDGDDRLFGGDGADLLEGGAGNDIFYVDDSSDRSIEEAGGGVDRVLSPVSYVLGANVEFLNLYGNLAIDGRGNSGANQMVGNGAANSLYGFEGGDILRGGGGDDRLVGGFGMDVLEGGLGADYFMFTTATGTGQADQIRDFATGEDFIALKRDVFSNASATYRLPNEAFQLGTVATEADDRILYDQASGRLFYDEDGVGGSAATLIARLGAGTVLTSDDVVIFG